MHLFLIIFLLIQLIHQSNANSICNSKSCRCTTAGNVYCYQPLDYETRKHLTTYFNTTDNALQHHIYDRISASELKFSCSASKTLHELHCSTVSISTSIIISECISCKEIKWLNCQFHNIICQSKVNCSFLINSQSFLLKYHFRKQIFNLKILQLLIILVLLLIT